MNPDTEPSNTDSASPNTETADVISCARALEDAAQNLCRATITRPHLTPADVDAVLAHLAAAADALPQAARQLSDILDQTRHHHALAMDTMTDTEDPDLAIDTARLHLHDLRQPATELYRHLDAAHNQTTHVATVERLRDEAVQTSRGADRGRPERREPPRMDADGLGQGWPRQPR